MTPGLSENGCQAQNNLIVQPIFPPKKAGSCKPNEQNFESFKEIGAVATKGFSQDGCLAPVVKI